MLTVKRVPNVTKNYFLLNTVSFCLLLSVKSDFLPSTIPLPGRRLPNAGSSYFTGLTSFSRFTIRLFQQPSLADFNYNIQCLYSFVKACLSLFAV